MSEATETDVVVVGCGPVGVMAALRCAQRGLRVVAIDRTTDIYPLPRAIGMDEETQDLFARAGLLAELASCSTPLLGADFVDATGVRVVGMEIPAGTVGALGHPPTRMFDQPSLERHLRTAAVAAGVDLRLGTEVVEIDPTTDRVRVALTDGSSIVCRWAIGADGASSTVRRLLDVRLLDLEFDQTWLVVDTTLLDLELPLPRGARQHCDPARVVTFVPGHDRRRRWEFQLKEHESREQAVEPDFVRSLLDEWGTPDQLQVDRVAAYRFHGVVAETFRRGPVFLAGDAAHQMPPFNGHGMCSGLRDAENLAWKLATVAAGQAGEALLDTYDSERRPHATSQVAQSVDAGKLIDAIAYGGERALESGYGRRKDPKIEHGAIVPGHRLVGRPAPRPRGDAAIDTTGWTVLLGSDVTAPLPTLWQQLGAAVLRLEPEALDHVGPDEVLLVRPDRIVAAGGFDLTAAADQLAPLFTVS